MPPERGEVLGAAGATRRPAAAPGPDDPRAKLMHLARELEGVFLNQLLQVMRESVPRDDAASADSGEQLFTSLFDQSVASLAASRMRHGIGEALYRQLERRLTPEPAATGADTEPAATGLARRGDELTMERP
jgi:Rod binding domain-containing protein